MLIECPTPQEESGLVNKASFNNKRSNPAFGGSSHDTPTSRVAGLTEGGIR
jgi:hypothetical protein